MASLFIIAKRNRSLQKERFPCTCPQPSANYPNCCTGNSFSRWLKVHLLNTAIIEQVIQNHQLSLQKPGGEIRAKT
jgi:hypothetical protein